MKKEENSQIFVSLFGVPKEKTKEEKEEEIKKNNPFLNRNEKSIIHPKNGSKKLSLVMDSMTEPVEKYYFFFTAHLIIRQKNCLNFSATTFFIFKEKREFYRNILLSSAKTYVFSGP